MEEKNVKKIKYELKELAEKLGLKGEVTDVKINFAENREDILGITIEVEEEKSE